MLKELNKYFLSEEKQKERLKHCEQCEEHIKLTDMCGKCKCYLPWKIPLPLAICPLHKW